MLELSLVVALFFGAATVISDDRLIRINRKMPLANFEEQNLFARWFTTWLGEDRGWTALQLCGMAVFCAMMLAAFLYPWIGWTVVAVSVAGLALVLFDLSHDRREMRQAMAEEIGRRSRAR